MDAPGLRGDTDAPLLSSDEVAGVLAATEDAGASAGEPNALPYSLREPVAIPPEAEPEARARMEAMTNALGPALAREAALDVKIHFEGFQQQRVTAALGSFPAPAWTVGFARAEGGGVGLALHPSVALAFVEAVLGGAGKPVDTSRHPTRLESRVMTKLATAIAPALEAAAGCRLAPTPMGLGELDPAVAAGGETVGIGVLRVELPAGARSALVLGSASILVTPRSSAASRDRAPGRLAERLARVAVRARPVIDAGALALSEIADMSPGTVVRLDVGATAPLELRVEKRPIFTGRIVRQDRGAVFVVDTRRGRTPS